MEDKQGSLDLSKGKDEQIENEHPTIQMDHYDDFHFDILDIPSALINSAIGAIFGAFIIYITIVIMVNLDIPSLTWMIIIWIIKGITNSLGLESISQIIIHYDTIIHETIVFYWNIYDFKICYGIAFINLFFEEMGWDGLGHFIKRKTGLSIPFL